MSRYFRCGRCPPSAATETAANEEHPQEPRIGTAISHGKQLQRNCENEFPTGNSPKHNCEDEFPVGNSSSGIAWTNFPRETAPCRIARRNFPRETAITKIGTGISRGKLPLQKMCDPLACRFGALQGKRPKNRLGGGAATPPAC